MTSTSQCPTCGAVLPSDAPGGSCPRCLLALGLRSLFVSADREEAPTEALQVSPGKNKSSEPFPGIDRYRIIEKIGEGGCGVVFRAEQLAPVRREVAIKIVKLGMDTKAVIARFAAERQTLALMDHPCIARVFDAGATRTGSPFFAMELVAGECITGYCDRQQVSIAQRLELFTQLCQAIQYAHQKGIIHRDLKPSNILVTEEIGRMAVKIIDFGVAKATSQQKLADQTLYTAFDQFVGTPAYMSPEQTGLTGEDIDTRTDIYSLGVLLYELLTGSPPLDPGRLRRAALNEVCRIIQEEEPARPSAHLTTLGAVELSNIARSRLAAPPRLISAVRGDLDWIVMRALEKDRTRRYDTASSLGDDIRRYLDHEPIAARPPSNRYRFGKWARRHRIAFAAGVTVAAALLAGFGVSSWMFIKESAALKRALRAEQLQEALRDVAESRAYSSDMNLATRTSAGLGSLGSVANLVSGWHHQLPDRRGWEWYYLNGICHPDTLTLSNGSGGFCSVAWSPDGKQLAAAGDGKSVTIWDAANGRRSPQLIGPGPEILTVAWSPDGKRLVSAGDEHVIRIWDVARAVEIVTLPGHDAYVNCVAWSPDGTQIATGGTDYEVKIWLATGGAELRTLRAAGSVTAVAWHPDGSRLASVGWDNVTRIWDPRSGQELRVLRHGGPSGFLRALAWSPDGRSVAVGGADSKVHLWDVSSGKITSSFTTHPGAVHSAAWSPDGRQLATTGRDDGVVKVWDPFDGRLLNYFRAHLMGSRSIAWHPTDARIASASSDGTVKVWDLNRPNASLRLLQQTKQVMSTAWHPNGRQLATASSDGTIRVFQTDELGSGALLGSHRVWAWAVAWNPTGTHLASAGGDGTVKLWDAATLKESWSSQIFTNAVRALAWSPGGQQLAVTGNDGKLTILDSLGNSLRTWALPMATSLALAWSPDGRQLAVEGRDDLIQILDAAAGTELRILRRHGGKLRSVAWSPSGARLASAADDGQAVIWDAMSGRLLHTLSGHTGAAYSISWSPDGTRLATASWDRTVKLWNSDTGQLLGSLEEYPSENTSVAWSPDGRQLAAGNLAGNVLIYDSRPGFAAERK